MQFDSGADVRNQTACKSVHVYGLTTYTCILLIYYDRLDSGQFMLWQLYVYLL